MTEQALLLVNLGSPASTEVADVRRYLNQFLMDPHVIDLPWPLRRLLVSLILARRPAQSAHAYASIWWPEGSPLVVLGQRLRDAARERAHAEDESLSLGHRNGTTRIEQIEGVRRLQHLFVGGQGELGFEQSRARRFVFIEMPQQHRRVGMFEVVRRLLDFVLVLMRLTLTPV
mgnify:CR=1 FL=1